MGIHYRRYHLPPLDLLPTFEAAARHLSFTKAGAELFLTQSAVSRQIQALEAALGMRLFERRTRALLLTEAGQVLLRSTQEALQRLDASLRALRSTPELRAVTLTTTPGFASLWLIPKQLRFTNAHPGIDVRTSATNQVIDLARGGVDLAIRYCLQSPRPAGQRLFGGKVAPVCSPRLIAEAAHPLVEPQDLAHFAVLYLDDPHAGWFDWNLWFHALGLRDFRPLRRLHFSHYDQMIQAAVNGQGIALGLDPLVRDLVREGKLVAPFRKASVPSRAWYLVRSPAAAGRAEVDAFVAWLLAEIKAESARPAARRGRDRRPRRAS
ncbi:MAG: LysR family transcriptional regulator [Burkholderiales bacterium]|nr:LysR family transcriptional regulator [Burkholderiales bacterium]